MRQRQSIRSSSWRRGAVASFLALLYIMSGAQPCDLNVAFTYSTNCTPHHVQFTNLTTSSAAIVSWDWNFGDSSAHAYYKHPVHFFPGPGMYLVSLTATDQAGCTSTFSDSVLIPEDPQPSFLAQDVCSGDTVHFLNTTDPGDYSSLTWLWIFGDGTTSAAYQPVHQYSLPGQYLVTLRVWFNNGCVRTYSQGIHVHQLSADFSFTAECAGDSVSFADLSLSTGPPVTEWLWDFGDGHQEFGTSHPRHAYARTHQATAYQVSLSIADSLGCMAFRTLPVNVIPLPVADFSHPALCDGQSVSFSDQSASLNGSLSGWSWDFGDGTTGAGATPSHSYGLIGQGVDTLWVRLAVEDVAGCKDTLVRECLVHPNPTAGFDFSDACTGEGVAFTDQSASPNGIVQQYQWLFDGTNGSVQACPSFTYNTSGIYYPELTIIDEAGCSDSRTDTIEIYPLPAPQIAYSIACNSTVVSFSDTGTHPAAPSGWSWDFGDNHYSGASAPMHYYSSPGIYQVTLTINDVHGCASETTLQAIVPEALDVNFQPMALCQHDSAILTGQLLAGTVPPTLWEWDFGDGTQASGNQVNHVFHVAGTLTVTLTVTDSNGCTDAVSHPVMVSAAPAASFTGTNAFFGSPSLFIDASQPTAYPIVKRLWDFGDGSPPLQSNLDTVQHVYPSYGTWYATLYVEDSLGCHDTAMRSMKVWSNYIQAAWVADTVCSGQLTQFNDQSMVASGCVVQWKWNFGDTHQSSLQNPAHSYDSAGLYQVVLTITSDLGVTDSASAFVLVHDSPVAEFDYSPSCQEEKKVFFNHSTVASGSVISWHWDFGDGGSSNAMQPERLYTLPGEYAISLSVVTDHGCVDTVSHTLVVGPSPEVAFVASKYWGCDELTVTFYDSSEVSTGELVKWEWDFGDSIQACQAYSITHTYHDLGYYDVTLTVTTESGCSRSLSVPSMVAVHPNPVAEFDFHPGDADIHRPTVIFDNYSKGAFRYFWLFGDGTSTTVFGPVHNYTAPGIYTISLTAETEYGCFDTKTRDIQVKAEPTFFVPDAFTPNGDGINDFFAPVGSGFGDEGAAQFTFTIYDRAGNLIFESSGGNRPWDGSLRGRGPAPEGVYVCRISYTKTDGSHHTHTGKVTLLH